MYRLLEKNIEELDKEELAQLLDELTKDSEDNPLLSKLIGVLKQYDEGKVKKHELKELNHVIRTLLAVLKKNKEEELRTIMSLEKEEEMRERELEDSMQCPYCAHLTLRKNRFCTECGKEIYNYMDKVCPRCNSLNNHDARYCIYCGKRFEHGSKELNAAIECPFCGKDAKGGITEVSASVRCTHCGAEWGGSREQYDMLIRNL
jgi:DNA-directed RNA polymerase subunit RPC12/RpoP